MDLLRNDFVEETRDVQSVSIIELTEQGDTNVLGLKVLKELPRIDDKLSLLNEKGVEIIYQVLDVCHYDSENGMIPKLFVTYLGDKKDYLFALRWKMKVQDK